MSDRKSADGKKEQCSLRIEDGIVSWNDREIYSSRLNGKDVIFEYYPSHIDPIYTPLTAISNNEGKAQDVSKLDSQDYSPGAIYLEKIVVQSQFPPMISTALFSIDGGESKVEITTQTDDPINRYVITNDEIEGSHWDWNTGNLRYGAGIPLLDYKDDDVKIEQRRKIVIFALFPSIEPFLYKYLNQFLGTIEGFYVAPHAYLALHGFSIITRPIYGFVRLRTYPDSRFYLQYERTSEGVLVGKFIRTRLMPFMEKAQEGEEEAVLEDQDGSLVPVCYSYYDPAGSGKLITREEYQAYISKRRNLISELTAFPSVLIDLLGF